MNTVIIQVQVQKLYVSDAAAVFTKRVLALKSESASYARQKGKRERSRADGNEVRVL